MAESRDQKLRKVGMLEWIYWIYHVMLENPLGECVTRGPKDILFEKKKKKKKSNMPRRGAPASLRSSMMSVLYWRWADGMRFCYRSNFTDSNGDYRIRK